MANYAWCTLVMLNEEYAKGAVVVAQSLRNHGTKYPLICMIDNRLSHETIDFLNRYFDKVIVVPTLHTKTIPMRSHKQRMIYSSWINYSFTKGNVYNLTDYDKVIFLDADMLALENIDDLFDLPAPAMCFSSPWAAPYHIRGHPNPYIIDGKELHHGQEVPKEIIKASLGSIVGRACMILVKPSITTYNVFKDIIKQQPFGIKGALSGVDEIAFAMTELKVADRIYHIHQQYSWIVGKPDWLQPGVTPKTYQWYNDKPWNGGEWPDLVPWWKVANEIIEKDEHAKKLFVRGINKST